MTVSDSVDVDNRLDALDDIALIKAHAALHSRPVLSEAEMHAHHALARQMALRGVPTGYGEDDPLSKVRILIDSEVIKATETALLDEDLAAAVTQFAEESGLTEVGIATFLTTAGYEAVVLDPLEIAASMVSAANDGIERVDVTKNDEMLKHPGHPDQSVHGRKGGGGVQSGSIVDRVRANGGLTVRANGQEPKTGYIVAVAGHNREVKAADFYDPAKGPAIIESYLKDKRDALAQHPPGKWLGLWHDTKHDEVVLDVVEQHLSKDSAIKAGRERNQQAIWDVKNFAEINTGGTGDRADKSAHADRGPDGLRDDERRADQGLRADGVGVGDGRVEKRTYARDSHGQFATTGTGGAKQSLGSNRHGGEYLDSSDHKILRGLQSKRSLALDYNDSYERGSASRDAASTPGTLGRFHDRMKSNMATLRANPTRTIEAETLASTVVQDAGWIDGALGSPRKYKRPLMGTLAHGITGGALGRVPEAFGKAIDPEADFDAIEKRQYVRDGKGQFATVAGHSSRSVLDPRDAKPDLIVITDPFGDEIRLSKADSLYHHMERKADGSYGLTPEREAFHQSLVDEAMAGVPRSKEPTMYMLGGGPAAGKTTMLEKGGLAVPSTGENGSKRMAVLVNADEVKVRMPEYAQMGKAGAGYCHEESSLIAKRVQGVAIAGGRDVVLDGTGDSKPQKLAAKIDQARSAGYKVEGHYATVPTQTAVDRAHHRGVRTGRVVPESVVRGTHADVSRTFPQAHHLFDSVSLYDTTDGAKRIAQGKRGGALDILDHDAYRAFLDKGQE